MDFVIALRTRTLTELHMRGFDLPDSVLKRSGLAQLYVNHWERWLTQWLTREGFTKTEIKPHRLPCCDYIYPNSFGEMEKHRQTATAHTELSSRFFKELEVESSGWQFVLPQYQIERFRSIVEQFLCPYFGYVGSEEGWAGKDTFPLASVLFDKIKVTFQTRSFIIGQSFRSFGVNPASGICGGYDFALQTYNGHPTVSLRWNEPRDLPAALGKFMPYLEDFCRASLLCSEAEMAAHRIMDGDWHVAKANLESALNLLKKEPLPQSDRQSEAAMAK